MRGELIVVITAGTTTDAYGNAADDWDDPDERLVLTVAPPEPRPAEEPLEADRHASVNGWTLYLPSGDPITAHDRVRVRGETYPVQGRPADWGVGVIVQAYRTEG